MIISDLRGGMGNQMFQYAFGRAISLKYNIPLELDLAFLNGSQPGCIKRKYDLDLFKCPQKIFKSNSPNLSVITEPHFKYSEWVTKQIDDSLFNDFKKDILLIGYWQSFKYFKEFSSQIKKDFELKKQPSSRIYSNMLNQINSLNSVMVNIRRTDYLNGGPQGVMSIKYYQDAKNYIESEVESPHYFIFGDDIEWAKNNLQSIFKNGTFLNHKKEYVGDRFSAYLELMKNCKHFIIPNSTFAWWSAYLSKNKNKKVVAPLEWFNNTELEEKDLLEEGWKIISKK